MKVGIIMNVNEFDIDFDFEKEYGFDTPPEKEEVPEAPAQEPAAEDFDLRAILNSDYGAEGDPVGEFNFDEYLNDLPASDPVPPVQYAEQVSDEPTMKYNVPVQYDEADAYMQSAQFDGAGQEPSVESLLSGEQPIIPNEASDAPAQPRRERTQRRKPRSKMRQFKDDLLPLIIAGAAAVLILIFIFGSIGRAISSGKTNNDKASDSQAQQSAEELEAKQARQILDKAAALAAGYDYQAAIDMLNTFTGDTTKYTDFTLRSSEYAQALTQLVAHNDPDEVANLSFHVLIADPSRAFSNQSLGGKYNQNFVTTDEFQAILEQLYANDFVLVSMNDFIDEVAASDGSISYASKTLYLPDGKKPIMITETMVNYYNYMIDGNSDGTPDANGAGFASRLVVQNGTVKAEMVDSSGNTVVGDYDLVPILENFIKDHPDFSYRGARATLAVSGYEGIFGYRIQESAKASKGETYYNEQVAGAKEVVSALRNLGYEIACYTYNDKSYNSANANEIQADIDLWTAEIVPVLGTVDTIVYAKMSDIASSGAYSGSKYNVLSRAGFRYFISNGTKSSTDVYSEYVRQNRIMVTGSQMYYSSSTYSSYFDSKAVLNSLRGNIPQA